MRYGLSFVIPLSGDCDTEDTTGSSGEQGAGAEDLIQFAYPRLYAALLATFAMDSRILACGGSFPPSLVGYRPRATKMTRAGKRANADKADFKLDAPSDIDLAKRQR